MKLKHKLARDFVKEALKEGPLERSFFRDLIAELLYIQGFERAKALILKALSKSPDSNWDIIENIGEEEV